MKRKPSKAARQAAPRIRNTKAELLDTITNQHKTIIEQTRAMAQIGAANDRNLVQFKMVFATKQWLVESLRAELRELLRLYDEGVRTTADHERMIQIRALVKL